MDEKAEIGPAALAAQPDDFGPRMILLGAAGLLHRIGRPQAAARSVFGTISRPSPS